MSGCKEEAGIIAYTRGEFINDMLEYIDSNCCAECNGQECIEDMNCKVDKIVEYLKSRG